MARIRSLIPKVTRNEAIEQFSPGGILSQFREVAFGPLRSLAEFYIPFRLYRVRIVNRGREEQRVFGLDAVTGSLDLYQFQELPGGKVSFISRPEIVPRRCWKKRRRKHC